MDNDSLAKQIFDVQCKLSLPGLVDECRDYLVKFGILMSEIGKMSSQ